MEKQVIIFDTQVGKKHSVCFKTSQSDAAVQSLYIMRKDLGKPIPKAIKMTIEEHTLLTT